jgi:D-alanyl-D-alanine carboxypeptidase
VLLALGGITLVLPLTHNVLPGDATFVGGSRASATAFPSTVEALMASSVTTTPPLALVGGDAVVTRAEIAASRSEDRSALPGCNVDVRAPGANGQLDVADLCVLWDGQHQLRADAAMAMAEMDAAYKARFGADLCIADGYRTLASQRTLKYQRGGLAATPGTSNHGWGVAVDFCTPDTTGPSWAWLSENGAVYGWANPDWAKRGGSGPHEPWHWEYTRGVQETGQVAQTGP